MDLSENLPETQLESWFTSLRQITPRSPAAMQNGRHQFLAEVNVLADPVSKSDRQRHNGWITSLIQYFKTKEYSPMYTTIASLILVLALMFGGSGAAALAARDSLPTQPLYQVKTFTEDLALRNTIRDSHRLQMHLDYAARRLTEMIRLREMQQDIPESTYQRFENHLDQALMLAVHSDDGEMVRALNQIRERLQKQINSLPSNLDHDPEMLKIHQMLQNRVGWAELGLEDPDELRLQSQLRTQFNQQAQYQHQLGIGPQSDPEQDPGEGAFGPGPQQMGPNNGDCQPDSCGQAPKNMYGSGPQAEEQHRHGSESDQQPAENNPNPDPGNTPSMDQNPGPGPASNQDQDSKNNQDHSSNPESAQGKTGQIGKGGTP
jgi:hypothetical protein